MEALMRKKSILMSLFMGMVMGIVFTIFAQLKNQGHIIPIGLGISILISMTISSIIGLIIPMKKVNDGVCETLKISPDKKMAVAVATSFVSNIIFTPLNCCVNMWYGMASGLTDVPPTVTNIFQKMMFCAGLPHFVPAFISTLIMDLVIGFFLCLIVSPLVNIITNRMCGIN